MPHRVFITGMGMVTCLGHDVPTNWEALNAGRSGIGPITLFDASEFSARIAGEVKGEVHSNGVISDKELRRMDRFQQFAILAAAQAVADAGLEFPPKGPYRYGVIIGSGMGGLNTIQEGLSRYREKGARGGHPLTIPKAAINIAPGLISMKFGFKGPNFGLANACASGTSAIGEAYRIVKEGRANALITGGSEAVVTTLALTSFTALRALSTRNDEPEKASRPFDLGRDGFVIAEGAGMMLIETEEHARARGARLLAEIVGYGSTDDAYHVVMPDPDGEGAYWSMKFALDDAGIEPGQVDYINAHGTSTDLNDKMETRAIKKLFGSAAYKVCLSSTKSMTGHLIGAAGAVEAIYCVLAIIHGIAPPTINLDDSDPECDLDYTPNRPARRDIEYALSNSFAFGGQNSALILRRAQA